MKYQVGDIVEGTITGIQPYGAFVSVDDKTNGLIHISEISDDFVKDIHYFIFEGEKLDLKVVDTDLEHNQLRLSLKALRKNQNRYRQRYQQKDSLPQQVIGFRSLEVNLPRWISEKGETEND